MGPVIALILQFLPQLIESLVKKEAFAAANGFSGPLTAFLDSGGRVGLEAARDCCYDPNSIGFGGPAMTFLSAGGKNGLEAAAASYARCCKEMPAN